MVFLRGARGEQKDCIKGDLYDMGLTERPFH